ncbi:TetR family transcriptional regulator [Nocardioides psychrotolerans]|uniref:Transcriptional regulator, TetR family n=1 Tax=Nocardioides psychrotolerans TaxID=1005945 RepID=A0A1I3PA31_9ACTN|nr:TetR family transcriptional regulator [Nocardioides psychrotolerans]GEP39622.1 TetR family transcriptional regulator [Nocardioides psychrotolerans]SFJ18261.1 transcriptional regulator, TetR family [Nocardioides psychrotolerans]
METRRTSSSRERMIRAAYELFEQRGFEKTTVDDIAARAGVGRTTFFRAFATKEDVIFPDHDTLVASVRERLAAATPAAALVAVTEAARLVLLHYLAEGDLARSRYRLTSNVPALRAREISGQRQYQRTFHAFIRTWMTSASGEETDAGTALRAELMADAVVTAHNHVLRQWLRGRTTTPEVDFDAAMAAVVELFAPQPAAERPGPGETQVVVLRTQRDLDDVLPELKRVLEGGGSP